MKALLRAKSPPTILPLNRDACEILATLHGACFPRGWTAEEFGNLYEQNNVVSFGCFDKKKPIGMSFGWLAGGDFELLTIAILPDYRKQGLANQLLEHTGKRAKELGAHRMLLEVSVNNAPAHALYAGFGFEIIGRRTQYYRHPDGTIEDALTMHCDI